MIDLHSLVEDIESGIVGSHCENLQKTLFPQHNVVYWRSIKKLHALNLKDSIIFLDDEHEYFTKELVEADYDMLRGNVVVTCSLARHKLLQEYNVKSVHWPFALWFESLIPLLKNKITKIKIQPYTNKNFNFLNGKWQAGRSHALNYIHLKYSKILDHGYVTANHFSEQLDPRITKDNNYGIEKLSLAFHFNNLFAVMEKFSAPISMKVESFGPAGRTSWMFTEKTLQCFLSGCVPLCVSYNPGLIAFLQQLGLDVFDDIVDQTYDSETNYFLRIEKMIQYNSLLLVNGIDVDQSRLYKNQNFILNEWPSQNLTELQHQVLELV